MCPLVFNLRKIICVVVSAAFLSTSVIVPSDAEVPLLPLMPRPGTMVHLSANFTPSALSGITVHPDNALRFDFLINKGDQVLSLDQKKDEYKKLVKYFLASLTIPDEDQWVNLSPYERDRIIKNDFGKTRMGRDLLAQDYLLKQLTSSLIYPEDGLGKAFWDKVYQRAWNEYHTSNIPVNTFNKVWIVPDQALVYESGHSAFILKSHLKVMLEEDYLSLQKNNVITTERLPGDMFPVNRGTCPELQRVSGMRTQSGCQASNLLNVKASQGQPAHALASQVIREIILPELEREVNEGKNFASLRQMYSGMVLATWYKRALKNSLLGMVYANKAKVKGVDQDPQANIVIYQQYLSAFKKGVFNYIKEDVDKYSKEVIPRKYFSGGFTRGFDQAMLKVVNLRDLAMMAPGIRVGLLDLLGPILGQTDVATVDLNPPRELDRRAFLSGVVTAGVAGISGVAMMPRVAHAQDMLSVINVQPYLWKRGYVSSPIPSDDDLSHVLDSTIPLENRIILDDLALDLIGSQVIGPGSAITFRDPELPDKSRKVATVVNLILSKVLDRGPVYVLVVVKEDTGVYRILKLRTAIDKAELDQMQKDAAMNARDKVDGETMALVLNALVRVKGLVYDATEIQRASTLGDLIGQLRGLIHFLDRASVHYNDNLARMNALINQLSSVKYKGPGFDQSREKMEPLSAAAKWSAYSWQMPSWVKPLALAIGLTVLAGGAYYGVTQIRASDDEATRVESLLKGIEAHDPYVIPSLRSFLGFSAPGSIDAYDQASFYGSSNGVRGKDAYIKFLKSVGNMLSHQVQVGQISGLVSPTEIDVMVSAMQKGYSRQEAPAGKDVQIEQPISDPVAAIAAIIATGRPTVNGLETLANADTPLSRFANALLDKIGPSNVETLRQIEANAQQVLDGTMSKQDFFGSLKVDTGIFSIKNNDWAREIYMGDIARVSYYLVFQRIGAPQYEIGQVVDDALMHTAFMNAAITVAPSALDPKNAFKFFAGALFDEMYRITSFLRSGYSFDMVQVARARDEFGLLDQDTGSGNGDVEITFDHFEKLVRAVEAGSVSPVPAAVVLDHVTLADGKEIRLGEKFKNKKGESFTLIEIGNKVHGQETRRIVLQHKNSRIRVDVARAKDILKGLDKAMVAPVQDLWERPTITPGGIDFNAAHLDLQIRRDGRGVPLPVAQQDMAQLSRIEGFEPDIIAIKPAVNVPIINELHQKLQSP